MAASRALKVLLVEDSEDDAALVLHALQRGGFAPTWERVETAEGMRRALDRGGWELVLSDNAMPRFSAAEAFQLVEVLQLDLPFIIVSGTIGEDAAITAMRMGVHDYLYKGDLARLVPAIERELREAVVRDERRKMQDQLLISDRMASVGALAAGVAHEINNPLAALLVNVDIVGSALTEIEQGLASVQLSSATREELQNAKESLGDALEAAHRVHQITRDLKVFSRSGRGERCEAVDVQDVLETSARMAWNEIRHRARLVKTFGDTPDVWAIESRLGQVFLNLLVNAAQAIPEGRCAENAIEIVTRSSSEGGQQKVIVEIRDTGVGIPDAVLPHIFEAFFTTKPAHIGTGLGLAICHRIVTSLGGELTAERNASRGSCFRVTLPVSERAAAPAAARPVSRDAVARGRVLVIDDEPMIGAAVLRIFAGEHQVTVLGSVQQALACLAQGQRFDVILCDLMMPEMTGIDLHAHLSRTTPELARRIIFMTGGAFTPASRAFLEQSSNARVEKPFEVDVLRSAVNGLIVGGPARSLPSASTSSTPSNGAPP